MFYQLYGIARLFLIRPKNPIQLSFSVRNPNGSIFAPGFFLGGHTGDEGIQVTISEFEVCDWLDIDSSIIFFDFVATSGGREKEFVQYHPT